MKFGNISARVAAHILFWGGLIVLLAVCISAGHLLSAGTEMVDVMRDAIKPDTSPRVPIIVYSTPAAIAWGGGLFIFFGLMWRMLCELFYNIMEFCKKRKGL